MPPYDLKEYKNVPQNADHIAEREAQGWEVYMRSADVIRLRRPKDAEPPAQAPATIEDDS